MAEIHLVLGGARSGKSGFSEQLALNNQNELHYIATAQAYDEEMQQRIEQHKADRSDRFNVHEVPMELPLALSQLCAVDHTVLVDCLTLWMSNLLMQSPQSMTEQAKALLTAMESLDGRIIVVSNEISMGVVPLGESNRQFVDEIGRLHQGIARIAQNVTLMVAGIPTIIKSNNV